ncbi:unnamed protein product [Boreogadus saida]
MCLCTVLLTLQTLKGSWNLSRSSAADLILKAPPGQCEKPKVSNISMDSMMLSWEEPEDDGGTPADGVGGTWMLIWRSCPRRHCYIQ